MAPSNQPPLGGRLGHDAAQNEAQWPGDSAGLDLETGPATSTSIPIRNPTHDRLNQNIDTLLSPAMQAMSVSPMHTLLRNFSFKSPLVGLGMNIGSLSGVNLDFNQIQTPDFAALAMTTRTPTARPQSPLYDPTAPWQTQDTSTDGFLFAGTAEELDLGDDGDLSTWAESVLGDNPTDFPTVSSALSSNSDRMWNQTPPPPNGTGLLGVTIPPQVMSSTPPASLFAPGEQLFADAGVDTVPPPTNINRQHPNHIPMATTQQPTTPRTRVSAQVVCGPGATSRDIHNAMERERRVNMRRCFDELRQAIPTLSDQKAPSLHILNQAAAYIKQLQLEDAQLTAEKEALMRHNEQLRQQIKSNNGAAWQ